MDKNSGEEKEISEVTKLDSGADDCHLISSAQDGDKEAFGRLVLKYQKRLFRFVFMMLGDKDATEDVVQEAFVKGYLALGTFELSRPFYPWVATIARNLAINRIKKSGREKPASEMEEYLAGIPDQAPDPLESLLNHEIDRRLARAVASLPEAYRVVFVMRMVEKMSYDQIAKTLKISPGTVDSRLFRARQKLMEFLKEYL
jgi:RNA polymerase sigma-70 factor (ECF subfamily)